MASDKTQGFTLVELLVVITIIVILLALLTPALDRAVYQAELTVCGANLKGVGAAVVGRAAERQRRYPDRVRSGPEPFRIKNLLNNGDGRAALRDYLGGLKPLICPLAGPVDLDNARPSTNGTDGDHVLIAYALWVGFRYDGEKGMYRLGDRWTANATIGEPRAFRLMGGDFCWTFFPNRVDGAHPDDRGVMYRRRLQNENDGGDPLAPIGGSGAGYVLSFWWNLTRSDRGLLDLNFLYDDGAVVRYSGVERELHDGRMTRLPPRSDNYTTYGADAYLIGPVN